MKKPPKSPYYGPICIILIASCYYTIYLPKKAETPLPSKDYKLFHVLATDDAWESVGKGSAICTNFNLLDDVSEYKQQFYFQNRFEHTEAISPVSIKKNVRKNDTLLIGVLRSDFEAVQDYSYNFIKNDFFSRELKVYWIKKKDLLLRTPQNCLDEDYDNLEEWLIVFSVILICAIGRIVYLISQKVKFFT